MTRYRFPQDRTSFVYMGPNQPILTPPRTALQLYVHQVGDALADVQTLTGMPLEGATIYTGEDGLVPEFLGPEDIPRVWVEVVGAKAARTPVQAQFNDLLEAYELRRPIVSALLSGYGGPDSSVGEPGSWYIDRNEPALYGPKRRTGGWPPSISLNIPAQVAPPQQSYVHYQIGASDEWACDHPLLFKPNVTCLDSFGEEIEGDVTYPTASRVVVRFAQPISGTALMS